MPSRTSVAALASVAVLGLAACEKQNPIVTLTAGGVVVKAKAVEYCRGDDCRTTDEVPTLRIEPGDILGIDVPRSVAEQGWSLGPQGEVFHDHYRSIPIGQGLQGGQLEIHLKPGERNRGVWRFNIVVER